MQEVTAIPNPRERDPNDKIKGKSGRQPKRDIRRHMTAKFRKELLERKRAGQETSVDTQAVDQVEQTGAASFEKVGREAGRLMDRAAHPVPKERTETIKGNGQHTKTRQRTGHAGQEIKGTACGPSNTQTGAAEAAPVSRACPAPGEQMKQQAAKSLKQTKQTGTVPQASTAPPAYPHYGGHQPGQNTPQDAFSLKNQSFDQSIKERSRRSTGPKEKPPGGASVPKTRKRAEQIAQKGTATVKTATTRTTPATKMIAERTRKKAQREAQRDMLQRSQKVAKAAADLSKWAVAAMINTVKAIISTLAALVGGGILVAALCVVILIAALIVSPFGILFSNEPSRDAIPLNAAVSQIHVELTDRLAELQAGEYDTITIQGQPPGWREVVAVFAAKTAGAEDGVDVAALTPDRVDRLRAVFWDMCGISAQTEDIEHPAAGNAEAWTETKLTITITPKTAEDMRMAYSFSAFQNQALTELMDELDALDALLDDLSVSQEAALALLRTLPEDLSPERRAVLETACKLVGKVNYFWGGKSLVIGWDSRWGQLRKVTAAGSSTTGTYRPYGMDCSGLADWVFYNASGGEYIIGHGGGAHAQHTYCDPIQWDEAQPGDLVFYPEDEHVGIVGGRDENGDLLVVHCASSANNVVITGPEGFTSIGRPVYYGE